ncbi:MAG: hypothetical protein RLZZ196_1097 [Bacteroidota bacterium]|jgi:hypothetical protein
MSKIKIVDVNVPTKGVGKYFFIKVVDLVVLGNPPKFYWEVYSEVVEPATEADEQPLKYPGSALIGGNLDMTEAEYAQWGTNDNYVMDWALQKLGFERL